MGGEARGGEGRRGEGRRWEARGGDVSAWHTSEQGRTRQAYRRNVTHCKRTVHCTNIPNLLNTDACQRRYFCKMKLLQLYSGQGTVQAYRAYKTRPSPKLT
eukprot:SAG11_NODE_2726_length_3040_cov_5.912955_2_plen_101_part_00